MLAAEYFLHRALRSARSPLFWMILVEAVVVGAAVFAGWMVLQAHRPHGGAPPGGATGVTVGLPAGDRPRPPVSSPSPSPSGRRSPSPPPTGAASSPRPSGPKANAAPGLSELNRDQAEWERVEWTIVDGLTRASRLYIERVVIPAVEGASVQ